jgi:ubiquinone/menaquinone biosynthesis C-methylase UbiE
MGYHENNGDARFLGGMMEKERTWRLDTKAAEFYEQNFVPAIFGEWAALLVKAAKVAPGERVLDVACGTGIAARTAADRVGEDRKVSALDLNSSMLGVARRVRPDIDWNEGDASNLPFDSETFDVVLCQSALMFFPDRLKALQQMRRVLRPGGRVAAQVFGKSPGYEVAAGVIEQIAGEEEANIFRAPFMLNDPKGVTPLFDQAGFRSISVQTHILPARYASLEMFARTEIDGWVLAGRVDTIAFLNVVHPKLKAFVTETRAVNIPLEGHIITAAKS